MHDVADVSGVGSASIFRVKICKMGDCIGSCFHEMGGLLGIGAFSGICRNPLSIQFEPEDGGRIYLRNVGNIAHIHSV
jgi:hypothetical protein